MKFTKENCLEDDYRKVFAMALLEKSGLEIYEKGFDISFENLFDLFSDPLSPTQEECTIFNLEYGAEYIIKPTQQECNTSE